MWFSSPLASSHKTDLSCCWAFDLIECFSSSFCVCGIFLERNDRLIRKVKRNMAKLFPFIDIMVYQFTKNKMIFLDNWMRTTSLLLQSYVGFLFLKKYIYTNVSASFQYFFPPSFQSVFPIVCCVRIKFSIKNRILRQCYQRSR